MSYYGPLLSSKEGSVPVLTETEIVAASGTGSGVSALLSLRTTGLSAYGLGGYLIYSNGEPEYIPRVPWLLSIPLSGLGFGLRRLPLVLRAGPSRYWGVSVEFWNTIEIPLFEKARSLSIEGKSLSALLLPLVELL
jgi:hypothetical protein